MTWTAAELRRRLRLYLIADAGIVPAERLPDVVRAAIDGGVTMVQLRAKSLATRAQIELAHELRSRCERAGVPFVVDDRADIALVVGADGVHVGHPGLEDLLPSEARHLLGADAIVGVSVGSAAEAAAVRDASYLSTGPMYTTTTKADAGPPAGPALVRVVRAATTMPLVAIGGILADQVPELLAAGADGVCVASGILAAADPARAARAFARALDAERRRGAPA